MTNDILFNREGQPIAFSNDGRFYFLFKFHPTAFCTSDNALYSFCSGKFLGWIDNDIVYDKNGYMIYTRIIKSKSVPKISTKDVGTITPIPEPHPAKPIFKNKGGNLSKKDIFFLQYC